jgi:hypothetical protein
MAKDFTIWIDARKRFHLSDAQIQMARELGLNPKKFGGMSNHRQEPWKIPLPEFIEEIYFKRFGKTQPDNVRSIETVIKDHQKKKLLRREVKKQKMASQQKSLTPATNQTAELTAFPFPQSAGSQND